MYTTDLRAKAHGLTLDGVTKVFGDKPVLRSIELNVQPGEFVSLLGPSGCGKSTALKIIGGFEQPTSGSVLIDGVNVTRTRARDRGTGIVFQQYSLFPHLTAGQNIEFGLKAQHVKKTDRRERVDELLELVGLTEHSTKFPHQLSGGQQQRIALARALAVQPKVLLLDEPLSALDALVRERLREEIVRIHRERGTTTIMVTHDQEEALAMADRVAVMHDGRVVQFDTPRNVYRMPEPTFVAGFIGIMNRIAPDEITDTEARIFGGVLPRSRAAVNSLGEVLIRPEDLSVELNAGSSSFIADITLRGAFTSITVAVPGMVRELRVDVPTGLADSLRPGDTVQVTLAKSASSTQNVGSEALV